VATGRSRTRDNQKGASGNFFLSNANAHNGSAPAETADQEFLERLRSATDLLEHLASNWAVLNAIPDPERERMHRVIAQLYNPDPIARKKRTKAFERERTATRIGRTEAVLDDTGIRTLRRKPGVHQSEYLSSARLRRTAAGSIRGPAALLHL
jgi:hypothetical protein